MQYRSGSQIREDFLRFFETKDHRRVHSSSLVPANDPTLLFTNAGMNQFKDVFLGLEKRDYTRATTSQKCVRAGGKHNDLENVGFTRRHHTFFEMLGNFSFGDYFKREAIAYAWELLTSPDWWAIPKDRLYVTIFEGNEQVPRDDEAEQFWIEAGVPKERIFEMGMKDNFWQMGDTGPCGPCSEIFYDLGLAASETSEDKPFPQDDQRYVEIWNLVFMQFERASVVKLVTSDEFVLNEQPEMVETGFRLVPLPEPSIDTGMGLERVSAVLQNVLSNFDTDLFTPLIAKAAQLTSIAPTSQSRDVGHLHSSNPQDANGGTNPGAPGLASETWVSTDAPIAENKSSASLRIIADHARAATFLINDGVHPANEGRGYVLRKILRRGIRHGRLLGQEKPFMHEMVYAVRDEMQVAYPELKGSADRVSRVVLAEEEQFARVIAKGSSEWDRLIVQKISEILRRERKFQEELALSASADIAKRLKAQRLDADSSELDTSSMLAALFGPTLEIDEAIREGFPSSLAEPLLARWHEIRGSKPKVSGADSFRLYETFGLPLDFMVDAARDAGIAFDMEGFERAKEEEQARARASWKGGSQKSASPVYRELPKTEFEGYRSLQSSGCKVLALVKDGVGVQSLQPGDEAEVVLDHTTFYADSGGQVGDVGWLYSGDHNTVVAEVRGCAKPIQGVFAHRVVARQPIHLNDVVDTVVNAETRAATIRNHTSTHLLHAALRAVLGKHVKQAGSLNDPTRLRFDFSHFAAIADEEMQDVEDIVNQQVLGNTQVVTFEDMPIETAVNELGAMALFGEKYGEFVRVVKIGDFSTELCGGVHTNATGEIGLIKLLGENSVSSGVRRIEAITGTGALSEFRRDYDVAKFAAQLGGGADIAPADALRHKLNAQDEELKKLRRELDQARMKSASASISSASENAVEVKGVKVLAQRVDALDKGQMRTLVDNLRTKLSSGIVVLGAATEDAKVALIVGVTKDLTPKIQAGKIVSLLAAKVGGKGGGRPDLAEAGGNDPSQLDAALKSAAEVVGSLLA
ncbi:MAG: alanine--tRNA ligase [Acidobacteriaceae bacterium]